MKIVTLSILILMLNIDPGKIGKINSLKSEAKRAFNAGDYKTAIEKYTYLTDSLHVSEDEIKLNLASAYFHQNDTANAISSYQSLLASENNSIKSIANQQMGIINNRQGKLEEALNSFKQAIKADPENKEARYNYEMLKKKIEEKKKQEEQQKKDQQNKDDKNKDKKEDKKDQKDQQKKDQEKKEQEKKEQEKKDQEKKDSENKDDKNKSDKDKKDQQQKDDQKKEEEKKEQEQQKDGEKKENEKKDMPPSVSEKLQQMKISEEKAKMLLEAMKNQEVQYLQQNKRKATKARDKGKPDW